MAILKPDTTTTMNGVNGRMRITNEKKNCGNTPIGKYVTGWVDKKNI